MADSRLPPACRLPSIHGVIRMGFIPSIDHLDIRAAIDSRAPYEALSGL